MILRRKKNLIFFGLITIIFFMIIGGVIYFTFSDNNIEFIINSKDCELRVGEISYVHAQFKKQEDKEIVYTSDSPEIVSINNSGELLAKKSGNVYIYAGVKGNEKRTKMKVIIKKDELCDSYGHIKEEIPMVSILEVGDRKTMHFKADKWFENSKLIYTSKNKDIVDVDESGKLVVKKAGVAKIDINIEGTEIYKEIEIHLKDKIKHVKKLAIDKRSKSVLEEGEITNLKIVISPENAENKEVIFQSSEPTIAKIDENGTIKGLRPGLATITATAIDNGEKVEYKIFVSKTKPYLTKESLENSGINECQKVMIVGHPDDETLWGGGHLLRDKYFVLCMTNSFNEVRKNEFYKALEFSGDKGIILPYPDLNNKEKSNWEHNKIGASKDIEMILQYKDWEEIATHSPAGETGHRHHKFTSDLVTENAKKHGLYNKLMYFGKFYEKDKVPKSLKPSLSQDEINKKTEMLKIYKAETKSIDAFWRQMVPFEYWKKAIIWKKS